VTPLLHDWVSQRAIESPDSIAVVEGEERMTYGEFETRSGRLAAVLTSHGVRSGDRVALLVPKSIRALVAIHGVLKAGGVYIPIDTNSPSARIEKIIESSEPRLVLADRNSSKLLPELRMDSPSANTPLVGWLEQGVPAPVDIAFSAADVASAAPADSRVDGGSEDLAHILFTSGSTGMPKGVSITHGNVSAFVEWAVQHFNIGPDDRNSGHHPLHFDLSTFDMYGTFAAGAELHLVPPSLNLLATKLAGFIRNHGLTQWFSVPSALNYMAHFDVAQAGSFPSLRRLMWCGEVLPTKTLMYWMRHLPDVEFTNLYGPTEATIASSYYRVPVRPKSETESVPIGMACDNESLHVLDEAMDPVPRGDIGDLYIGGVGLSPGYWRDAEKTQAAFRTKEFPDGPLRIYRTGDLARIDEAGTVHYLGREDSQIKSRGYRIELGEIETAVSAIEGLGECAVVAVDSDGFAGKVVCCAYTLRPGHDLTAAHIRKALARAVPRYMLPAHWMEMEVLPKNANGKIDRRAIRERMSLEQRTSTPTVR